MAEPDKDVLNEEDLELLQHARLLEAFVQVKNHDARESIIEACEKLIKLGK